MQMETIMEDEASLTVGPATAALSQLSRMSSMRSAGPVSSRMLSLRSHASRHGKPPLSPPANPHPHHPHPLIPPFCPERASCGYRHWQIQRSSGWNGCKKALVSSWGMHWKLCCVWSACSLRMQAQRHPLCVRCRVNAMFCLCVGQTVYLTVCVQLRTS